ncbi:MAG: helicase-related protein [Candidatus Saccharibacteria bacterium]
MTTDSFDSVFELPVYARRDEILASVDNNQVTIITAETGAGKSTQVPQYLAEHGYQKIIVTQPRILAARNLCTRVRQEYSWRTGHDATDLVGYRTAHERDDNPADLIMYCTDGLQLVRELTGIGTRDKQVLVLDEIHEWNENMEVLIAWAKKRCQEDSHFKVVLMSATIEANDLANYFGGVQPISIVGRSFAVEKRFGKNLVSEIIQQLETREASNMLVFLPGKAEIENVADAIGRFAKNVPVIPLHSQLSPEMQQRAFESYPQGKVVLTTNVAQTSITIDDIDTVIDSGLERRAEVRNGVEGLFIEEVSQADCMQRAGRAGRTKEGLYILARLERLPCSPMEERPAYGVPEIMRKHIDRLVLRLSAIGIDIENLDFYHAPSRRTIKLAKSTLVSLGAVTTAGLVTEIGQKMERFPVESSYARMLVEAEQYSTDVQAQLASIIAIQEVGGIVKGSSRYSGWRQYTRQTRSDLLAQYDVYCALATIDPMEYDELGIIDKNTTKAQEVNERLNRDLGLGDIMLGPVEEDNLEHILQCIVAGQLHQIWAVEPTGEVTHIATKQKRELSSGTVVRHAGLVAGTPFDLQVPVEKGGLETLHLVNEVTAVNPLWLEKLAPELFKTRPGKKYFDERYGMLVTRMLVTYNGKTFEAAGLPVTDNTPENQKLFVTLYAGWLLERVDKERRQFSRDNGRIPLVPIREIQERIRYLAPGVISLSELSKKQHIELAKLTHLETYLGERFMATLKQPGGGGFRKRFRTRGWQPRHKRKSNRGRD